MLCFVSLLLCREKASSPVSAITEKRDMGLHDIPCLCWVWDGGYDSQLPYVWYYVVLRAVSNMLVMNASP